MASSHTSEINKQIFFFFSSFKDLFSDAQFENFIIFILGLLQDSKHKKITNITELTDNLKDHSVLNKFLQSNTFSTYHIKEKLRELFLKLRDFSKNIYLYIDDSLIEKAGKKVRADWNYSATTGGFLFSNCIVVGLIKNANLEFPFDFKKYFQQRGEKDKAYRSKLDLCLSMINKAVSYFGKNIYVLFDSWYSAAKVINKLKKDGIKFITRMKSNRVISSLGVNLRDYATNLNSDRFTETKIGDKTYFVYSEFLVINKIGILENYIHRWEIEQFFSDAKEYLGFEDYQEIKQVAVSRHITLLFSTYFLISVIRSFIEKCSKVVLSIGLTLKKIREGISDVKLTLLRRLYQRKLEVKLC